MTRALVWFLLPCLATACVAAERGSNSAGEPNLDRAFASRAVSLSLHCVDAEEPHWDEGQGKAPHAEAFRHPAFFGCFDWHSAVHGHWAMLRALDHAPDLPERSRIVAALSRHLRAEAIQGELASITKIEGFETPYGFAWGLRLAEELHRSRMPEAAAWREAFQPLERKLVEEIRAYVSALPRPSRVGTHANSAFAMIHAWDYAAEAGDGALQDLLRRRARDLFLADQQCPLASEPAPTDFLSPCFVEADLMRRVLPGPEFADWFAGFLPRVEPALVRPVAPADPQNYFQVHLVGLMYQKASAMAGVAGQLPSADPRRAVLLAAAREQVREGGKLLFDSGYGGTHWLASFALYYYTGVGR